MLDRDRLFAAVPPGHVLKNMAPAAQGSIVRGTLHGVLDAIEDDGREPDAWEGDKLLDAMQALHRGRLFDALGACAEALARDDERGPGDWTRSDETATLVQLRRALAHAPG